MSDAYVPSQADDMSSPSQSGGAAARPVWLVPALVVASLVFCFAGQYMVGRVQRLYYPPPHGQLGDPPEWLIEVRHAMMKNDAIGFGAVGAIVLGCLGGLMGLTRSVPNAAIGLLIGAVAGLVAGSVSGASGYYIQNVTAQNDTDASIKTFFIWGPPMLCFALAAACLPMGQGMSHGISKCVMSGVVAALISLVIYVLAATFFFISYPNQLFAEDPAMRHLSYIMLGAATAMAVSMSLIDRQKAAAPAEATE